MATKYQPYNSLTAGGAFDVTAGGMTPAPNMSTQQIMTPAPAPTATPKTNNKTATTKVTTPTAPTAPAQPTAQESGSSYVTEAAAFRDQYGYNPTFNDLNAVRAGTFTPAATSSIPSIAAADTTAVESPGAEKEAGEQMLREARERTDGVIGMMGQYTTEPLFSTEEAQRIKEGVMSRLSGLGELDEEAIRRAGEAAASRFDPMIADAQQSAREGRGANLARAARLGQLDTTATAGIAALTGTENIGLREGRAFEGTGGVLSKFGAEYDRNISELQAAQIQARQAAEEAERQFQLTGDAQAFEQAQGLYDIATSAYNERNKLIEQRDIALQRALQNAQTQQDMQFDFEDRLLSQLAPQLVEVDANGNIGFADDATIRSLAESQGVSEQALRTAMRQQAFSLEAVQAEQRQAVLDQMKTQAEIGATQALQGQREASALETQTMLPLEQAYKQAQIQSQQASAARSYALAQKARETPDELSVEEGVELLRLTGNTKELPGDEDYKADVILRFSQQIPQTTEQLKRQREEEIANYIRQTNPEYANSSFNIYDVVPQEDLANVGLAPEQIQSDFDEITSNYANLFGGIYTDDEFDF